MSKNSTETPYLYEEHAKIAGYQWICGVDEAGRGPLAGDVYAGAVILDPNHPIHGLDDSKKLSEKKRDYLFSQIQEYALSYAIATATAKEIDTLNILQATLLAMQRAVAQLKPAADYALIDGNKLPKLEIPALALVKGDSLSASISAASILAKVARDRYMEQLDKEYPQYGFAQHKGYPTKEHYMKILEHGVLPCHRKSFLKNLEEKREQYAVSE